MKRLSGHLSHFILIEMSTIWRLSEQIELMLNNDYRYPWVLPEHVCFSCWVERDWFVALKGRTTDSQVQAWKYSRFKNHGWCHRRTSEVPQWNEISISISNFYRIFFIYGYFSLKRRLKCVNFTLHFKFLYKCLVLHCSSKTEMLRQWICKGNKFDGNEIFINNHIFNN